MMAMFIISFVGCVPDYRPATYATKSYSTYDNTGKPAIEIECKQATADCLQEAGSICLNNGYEVVHNESLDRGSVTNSSSSASAVAITKNYAVGSADGHSESTNIQDHYLIIRCNSVDSIGELNRLNDIRSKIEADRYVRYQKENCGYPGFPACPIKKGDANRTTGTWANP